MPELHEVLVLRGVDLDGGAGELVMVIGPSGHSKSTLLNCLSSLDDIDTVTVTVDGYDLFACPTPTGPAIAHPRMSQVARSSVAAASLHPGMPMLRAKSRYGIA